VTSDNDAECSGCLSVNQVDENVVQIEECVHENRDAIICDLGNAKAF
jgi:hypothetical protein